MDTLPRPQRILVVKLCCIGDVIFLTPALRALRQGLPDADIAFLGSSWVKDVLESVPFIDRVVLFDATMRGGKLQKIRETLQLIRRLRRERFDCMIVAHRNPVFAKLGWLCGIKTRIGFGPCPTRFLTHAVPFRADQYEVERYLDLVKTLGLPASGDCTELTPSDAATKRVSTALRSAGVASGDYLVGIFPGGGENPGTKMPIKRWEADNYVRLCNRIAAERGCRIALLGGPGDLELAAAIQSGLDPSCRPLNLAGKFSLGDTPALLKQMRLVVGGDTGPMHMAAAVGTPTVFLFGPSDPRLVAPRHANSAYVWKHVHCSPCYTPESVMIKANFQGKDFVCRTGTLECLRGMSVGEVFEAVRPFLGD